MDKREIAVELSKRLADQGRLIAAGFYAFRAATIAPDASDVQVDEMRVAFMAGAQHTFGSLMSIMEAGAEPTENDLRRMSQINDELGAFINEMRLRSAPNG